MGILDGRIACVTGGTRGLGRDEAKGATALGEMNGGDNVHFIAGDMTKREDCEALVQGTVDHFGKIDILDL